MKKPLSCIIATLLTLIGSNAQEPTNRPNEYVASVRELKGTCFVRENGAAKPRQLKADDRLQAGQQLQCEANAHLKIRFRNSATDKEIKTPAPDWFTVPNVPAVVAKSSGAQLGGRAKGNGDPPHPTAAAGSDASDTEAGQRRIAKPGGAGDFDEVDQYWKSRKKYFLILAASKTGGVATDLPFTKVDAREISRVLSRVGYEKLEVLDNKTATQENVISQLQKIRTLSPNDLVVIYYSGHAVTDPQGKDLWLQLDGQSQVGDYRGISVSNLVGAARGTTFKGELAIILDTCYSGQGALTSQLSLRETENTVIFASSASYQQSYSMVLPSGVEISAFTYFLMQGLESDWARVDGDADGIIVYSDLQGYIRNRLMEMLRDRAIPGSMQPQLFGQSPRNWAAYDASKARNFSTAAREGLRLERALELQDPEKLIDALRENPPAHPDAYFKALMAIDDEKYDEAWRFLDEAEQEQKVSLAGIYWARGYLKSEQAELGAARDWFEKALAATTKPPVELVAYAGMMNFTAGNWLRAQELLKQVVELSESQKEENEFKYPSMALLVLLNLLQGDKGGAELYLGKLKEVDPKTLEAEEEGASLFIPFLELMSDIIQDNKEGARRKLAELKKALANAKGDWQEGFSSLLSTFEAALNPSENGKDSAVDVAATLRDWGAALKAKNYMALTVTLTQVQVLTESPATGDQFKSKEVDDLLKRTIELANPKIRTIEPNQSAADESAAEEERKPAGAMLLSNVAGIYSARGNTVEAERLFKQAIALASNEKAGMVLALNAVLSLGDIYQQSRRFGDAEALFNRMLADLHQPLGDQSFYVFLIRRRLGGLYEDWGKWPEAENAYRMALQLTISGFGVDSIMADDGRGALAKFLAGRDRHAEAAQLLEEAIYLLEHKAHTFPGFFEESLSDHYFALGSSYYTLGRYDSAEKSLQKAFDLFSERKEMPLVDMVTCLEWQWATADVLKKSDQADLLYKRMIELAQSSLAKPSPDQSLGSRVENIALWFGQGRQPIKGEQLFRLALAAQEKVYGKQSFEVGHVWESSGQSMESQIRYGDALKHFKTALDIYQKQPSPDPLRMSFVLYRMGTDCYERQDFEEAGRLLEQSVKLIDDVPEEFREEEFIKYRYASFLAARVQRILGRYESAQTAFESLLKTDEAAQPRWPSMIASDLIELATISRLKGRNEEAARMFSRAQSLLDEEGPEKNLARRAVLLQEQAVLALASGQLKPAEAMLRDAFDKAQKDPQMDQLSLSRIVDDYAKVLRQRGKTKDATLLEQRANEIRHVLKNGNAK
jgi:tetratricopeptide (TPR) repeat protein